MTVLTIAQSKKQGSQPFAHWGMSSLILGIDSPSFPVRSHFVQLRSLHV